MTIYILVKFESMCTGHGSYDQVPILPSRYNQYTGYTYYPCFESEDLAKKYLKDNDISHLSIIKLVS
jgi:hypothetical protein